MQDARNAETGMYMKYMRISSTAQRGNASIKLILKFNFHIKSETRKQGEDSAIARQAEVDKVSA